MTKCPVVEHGKDGNGFDCHSLVGQALKGMAAGTAGIEWSAKGAFCRTRFFVQQRFML